MFYRSGIPSTCLAWRETTLNSHKQTNKNNYFLWSWSISHYQTISVYLAGDQKIDSENIGVLLLENVKEQKRNNEMPKGRRLGKTEQDIAFRYTVKFRK